MGSDRDSVAKRQRICISPQERGFRPDYVKRIEQFLNDLSTQRFRD
jgi:hypothetical protein